MFYLRMFGGLALERDGAPYSGPAAQRRRLALLALVAASEAGVGRERLATYLWPDADATRARHSVDDALSALRRELHPEPPLLGVATLRLNPAALASDIAEQAAALRAGDIERAVSLYVGPFLDGFFVPGTAEFERWVEMERSRRARAHGLMLEHLAVGADGRGDRAGAVRWRRECVAIDPLDTAATLQLLHALVDAGNGAEALRLARRHEALVSEELGTSPGPEWARIVLALRDGMRRAPAVMTPLPATAAFAVRAREH